MLLIPLAFPGVVTGKITGKAFKESVSIEAAGKGREEILKLCLIPWPIVWDRNRGDTSGRWWPSHWSSCNKKMGKCVRACTSTDQVLEQSAKWSPSWVSKLQNTGPTNSKQHSSSSGLKYSSCSGLMQRLAKADSRRCLGWLSALSWRHCARHSLPLLEVVLEAIPREGQFAGTLGGRDRISCHTHSWSWSSAWALAVV